MTDASGSACGDCGWTGDDYSACSRVVRAVRLARALNSPDHYSRSPGGENKSGALYFGGLNFTDGEKSHRCLGR